MKALKSILAFALGLVCTVALAQDSLKEAVAEGNKVYVRIVNDQEHPIPADEIEDVSREFAAAGAWERVEEASEADFILNVEAKKKVVFNSPRTWLTPSVIDKEGNVLWKGDTYKADATMFNGYRSTNTCIRTVKEKGFEKNLFKKAGR
jgi:hypothetical protein